MSPFSPLNLVLGCKYRYYSLPLSLTFQDMKTIEVAAAVIIREGKVFATQRGYGQWQGWWEFPGGKIEREECPHDALVREIREELDAEIVTLEREGKEEFEKKDMSAYTKYTFSMYGDEPTSVTMVFQNRMIGVVIDRFGRDVLVMKEDDNHFRITVPVAVSDQFFGWVFGLGKAVRIVGPESVKEKMKKALEGILERYE